ncbi:zinc-finger protein [Candidatus Ishikawaella capsulata Mpkobe]|uniref:Zinc-finger protein n=2 Tax=Candidatus Ishikawella capsulata TaxID=168169 RepID=C5WD35_9ENTR|nr:zinc-finger protein [Candidatus Ishikawaella capsulata Mpkobe]
MKKQIINVFCPYCRKLTQWNLNKWRPFCSQRCQLIDLAKWTANDRDMKK